MDHRLLLRRECVRRLTGRRHEQLMSHLPNAGKLEPGYILGTPLASISPANRATPRQLPARFIQLAVNMGAAILICDPENQRLAREERAVIVLHHRSIPPRMKRPNRALLELGAEVEIRAPE